MGGSAGGLIVSLGAPLVFPGFWEYPILAAVVSLLLVNRYGLGSSLPLRSSLLFCAARIVPVVLLTGLLFVLAIASNSGDIKIKLRNYYGISRVMDMTPTDGQSVAFRSLISGSTLHGVQFPDESRKHIPTLYYHLGSGLPDIFSILPDNAQIAAVGLGVGAFAAYTRPSDLLDVYELQPSNRHDCPAVV